MSTPSVPVVIEITPSTNASDPLTPITPTPTAREESAAPQHAIQQPSNSTQPPTVSTAKRASTRTASKAWTHFTKQPDNKAKCNYCGIIYRCDTKNNGTSNLLNHIEKKCPKFSGREKKQKLILVQSNKGMDVGGKISAAIYSEEACRTAIAEMIIMDEQPFRIVEGEGFRKMCKVLEPRFNIPSRFTITRDCLKIYAKEKERLRNFLVSNHQRVCLTTDTWTSIQNLTYMVLTAHFIDAEWKYHKKILNFCQISSHKGMAIGKAVETCLLHWGISRVLTVTVDNASANDKAIQYLAQTVTNWNEAILDCRFMHMRCCAHILNLIVKDGLSDHEECVDRIRGVVKYARASPARIQKFKWCAEREMIISKKLLCLDSLTRWNSTYLMLEAAEKYEKAFKRLESHDVQFLKEFCIPGKEKNKPPPSHSDWEKARALIKFLKVFYDSTLKFSGSTFVTCNSFLTEICAIRTQLVTWSESRDLLLKVMATNMRTKFDKYWGEYHRMNPYLFVAILLDPRYKLWLLKLCFCTLCGEYLAAEMTEMTNKVRSTLNELYDQYKLMYSNVEEGQIVSQEGNGMEVDVSEVNMHELWKSKYKMADDEDLGSKTEVDRYILETREADVSSFDILAWWKLNSSKYKILSHIARDLLAIPVSTVASESAFSTGGRVLDSFRSSLSPRTVEALICTQNWLRSKEDINLRSYLEEIEAIESEILGANTGLTYGEEDLVLEDDDA